MNGPHQNAHRAVTRSKGSSFLANQDTRKNAYDAPKSKEAAAVNGEEIISDETAAPFSLRIIQERLGSSECARNDTYPKLSSHARRTRSQEKGFSSEGENHREFGTNHGKSRTEFQRMVQSRIESGHGRSSSHRYLRHLDSNIVGDLEIHLIPNLEWTAAQHHHVLRDDTEFRNNDRCGLCPRAAFPTYAISRSFKLRKAINVQ